MSLFSSILPCLLAAFALGALLGWALKSWLGDRRVSDLEESWAARLRGKESEWETGTTRLRSQLNTLQTDYDTSNATLRAHEASLAEWNTKYGALEATLATRTGELDKANAEWSAKYKLLEADLSAKNAELTQANTEWDGKYAAIAAALAAKTAAFDKVDDDWKAKFLSTETRLAEKSFALERANAEWSAKYKLLEDSLTAKGAEVEQANAGWLSKYGLLEAALAAKALDFDKADADWKAKYHALEASVAAKTDELDQLHDRTHRMDELEAELVALRKRLVEVEATNGQAKDWEMKFLQASGDKDAEIKELQRRVGELEPLQAQTKDWELKYTAMLQERDAESAHLRGRISELEPLSLQLTDWQTRYQTTVAEKDETIHSLQSQLSAAAVTTAAASAASAVSAGSAASAEAAAPAAGGDLREIEGIGDHYWGKLNAVGLYWQKDLLAQGATKKGRSELAAQSDINEKLILRWVNHIDLIRINGIGPQFAELLEAAGVDSVPELAQRNAENLHAKLTEVNDARNLVGRNATLAEVTRWIEEAKTLPRVVTH